jgi:hypothetical protein
VKITFTFGRIHKDKPVEILHQHSVETKPRPCRTELECQSEPWCHINGRCSRAGTERQIGSQFAQDSSK